MQNAQRVERQQLHAAICLIVKGGGQIGRAGCDIRAAAGNSRDNFIRRSAERERIIAFVFLHDPHHADARRPLERIDARGVFRKSTGA